MKHKTPHKETFEKKYVIVGDIIFDEFGADILLIDRECMCYSENELYELFNYSEKEGFDYIILPDYLNNIRSGTRKESRNVSRILTMCNDIGWGDGSF